MSGKWKIAAVSIASIVLITVNLYLIEKKESKVERTVFVENWTKVKKDTITDTIQTNGVIKPVEEYDIYFDAKKNDFKKFLVKEGDAITAGSSLFEFTTTELDALKTNLEAEKTAAEGEIAGIEEYIGKLRSYQGTVTSEPEAAIDESVEKNLNIDITTSSSDLIKSNIEQEMYKQELEKNRLDEKVKMLDAKLSSIEQQSSAIVTTSEADGVVKNINKNLNNPIISIVSTNMAIEGDFSEEEMKKAEVGMTIKASSSDSKKALKGKIGRIHSYPAEEPSLKKDNRFPFQALIEPEGEETEPLLVGSKVNLTVITNEKAGVPSIPIEAVQYQKQPYIYKLTNKGHVDKHYITKGLKAEGKQEIIKGPSVGDVILLESNAAVKNHSYFITPIQFEKVKARTYKKFTSREKVRYLLLGILEK
ncbi:efflux RND transporter periplasmic adaptor subunit [Peribacillus castrilensis]|uniref:Secretion protein, protein transporter n=1 Tax=Peribacillus simplex TaxID=1478 RepID=A0AAN2TQ12_9BACI|nr:MULTISPECIES: efflux RND transporter periplasmic adaptor subunit [Bacillaceae]MCP1097220.1 efflux RND transporter periplasmic adaptor subunit [Bacillaceae bacterium OS4b]MCF7620371.1 efflux RND transporter periplasmic adaptor subunit [Peribacillus frigoritolerans]MCP1151117.1 efflux RND transporter periplasmic adaptor subunit [Peribacillus frigoritolerans]MCT1391711.1 efflux RND transporter periplasmic adaptor subunit [Peribacillus frigoritolerans]NCT35676.1 efflux RND transporter periplasm